MKKNFKKIIGIFLLSLSFFESAAALTGGIKLDTKDNTKNVVYIREHYAGGYKNCVGVLLSPYHAATSAHCIFKHYDDKEIYNKILERQNDPTKSEFNYYSYLEGNGGIYYSEGDEFEDVSVNFNDKTRRVKKAIIPKKSKDSEKVLDLAILVFDEIFNIKGVPPYIINPSSSTENILKKDTQILLQSRRGKTNFEEAYFKLSSDYNSQDEYLVEFVQDPKSQTPDAVIQTGDSGSPVFFKENNEYKLLGVMSSGVEFDGGIEYKNIGVQTLYNLFSSLDYNYGNNPYPCSVEISSEYTKNSKSNAKKEAKKKWKNEIMDICGMVVVSEYNNYYDCNKKSGKWTCSYTGNIIGVPFR